MFIRYVVIAIHEHSFPEKFNKKMLRIHAYNMEKGAARSANLGKAFTFESTTICFSCEMYPFM